MVHRECSGIPKIPPVLSLVWRECHIHCYLIPTGISVSPVGGGKRGSREVVENMGRLEMELPVHNFTRSVNTVTLHASIDGIDCPIMEPSPLTPSFYSQKMNGTGPRDEIGLGIESDLLV